MYAMFRQFSKTSKAEIFLIETFDFNKKIIIIFKSFSSVLSSYLIQTRQKHRTLNRRLLDRAYLCSGISVLLFL